MNLKHKSVQKEIIDSLMGESEKRSPLQIFELKDLKKILEENYDLIVDLEKSKFHTRSVNHSYYIFTNKGEFFLRVSENERFMKYSLKDFKFEMEALNYLYSNQIPVIVPYRRLDDEYVSLVKIEGEKFYYSLFSFAKGKHIKKLSKHQYYKIGELVGKIHLLFDNWKPNHTRFSYDDEVMFNIPIQNVKNHLTQYPEIENSVIEISTYAKMKIDEFTKKNKDENQIGIIHGDMHTFNVHFNDDGNLTLFDFDFMGYGLKLFDIASFMEIKDNTHSLENSDKVRTLENQKYLIDGYNTTRKLSKDELDLIPTLKIIRGIIHYGLWAYLIGSKAFRKDHLRMEKYIIGLYTESISKMKIIIENEKKIIR